MISVWIKRSIFLEPLKKAKEQSIVLSENQDVLKVTNVKNKYANNYLRQETRKCKFCNRTHVFNRNNCPAYGKGVVQ